MQTRGAQGKIKALVTVLILAVLSLSGIGFVQQGKAMHEHPREAAQETSPSITINITSLEATDTGFVITGNVTGDGLNPEGQIVESDTVSILIDVQDEPNAQYPKLPVSMYIVRPNGAETPYTKGSGPGETMTQEEYEGINVTTFEITRFELRDTPVWSAYGGVGEWRKNAPEKVTMDFQGTFPLDYAGKHVRIRAQLAHRWGGPNASWPGFSFHHAIGFEGALNATGSSLGNSAGNGTPGSGGAGTPSDDEPLTGMGSGFQSLWSIGCCASIVFAGALGLFGLWLLLRKRKSVQPGAPGNGSAWQPVASHSRIPDEVVRQSSPGCGSCLFSGIIAAVIGMVVVGGISMVALNFFPTLHLTRGAGDPAQILKMIGGGFLAAGLGVMLIQSGIKGVSTRRMLVDDEWGMSREKRGCAAILAGLSSLFFGILLLMGGLAWMTLGFYQELLPWLGF